jgi:hypothetical protein
MESPKSTCAQRQYFDYCPFDLEYLLNLFKYSIAGNFGPESASPVNEVFMSNQNGSTKRENTLVPSFDLRFYVRSYEDAVPIKLLEALQTQYTITSDEWTKGRYGHVRQADTIDICSHQSLSKQPQRLDIVRELQEHTRTAFSRYSRSVGLFLNLPIIDRGFELLKYPPGTLCGQHYDFHLSGSLVNQFMVASMVININDDYEGGHMTFWNGEIVIPAKRVQLFSSQVTFFSGMG